RRWWLPFARWVDSTTSQPRCGRARSRRRSWRWSSRTTSAALDKSTAKRHHFLSQFLLRGFADTHNGKDCLFQMETKNRRAPIRVDVRTAASRRRLYAVPDEDGKMSNRNEGYLALVEEHAAPALRHLLDDP